jgi:hypothetical protein
LPASSGPQSQRSMAGINARVACSSVMSDQSRLQNCSLSRSSNRAATACCVVRAPRHRAQHAVKPMLPRARDDVARRDNRSKKGRPPMARSRKGGMGPNSAQLSAVRGSHVLARNNRRTAHRIEATNTRFATARAVCSSFSSAIFCASMTSPIEGSPRGRSTTRQSVRRLRRARRYSSGGHGGCDNICRYGSPLLRNAH